MNEQNDKARVSTGNKDLPEFTLLGDDDLYLFSEGSHLTSASSLLRYRLRHYPDRGVC